MANLVATDVEIAHMMRHSFEPVVLINDVGYFVMVSYKWEEILGFTRKQLCQKPFKYFLHKEDYDTIKAYHESPIFNKSAERKKGFINRYRTTTDGKYAKFRWIQLGMNKDGFSVALAEFLEYEYS